MPTTTTYGAALVLTGAHADGDDQRDDRLDQHRDHAHDLVEVRAWARSRGYPVDESARVPLHVLRTYRRVHAS